jgi:serine protease
MYPYDNHKRFSGNTWLMFIGSIILAMILLLSVVPGYGQEPMPAEGSEPTALPSLSVSSGSRELPTNQLILRFKADYEKSYSPARSDEIQRLSETAGAALDYFREMSGEAHVFRLPERLPMEQVRQIAQRLSALPEVDYAEPDRIFRPVLTPNDPQYASQWHYYDTYGINAPGAWDLTTGSSSVVAAVIDTGILNHTDLNGRTVAGYDFISDVWTANDGDGRDSNPSDPGDWVSAGDCGVGEPAEDSSWHGSHVAGTIGAASNNSIGVTGINWVSKILPVRVLGRCGGYDSDIADAIRWAAGLSVAGVPANANPAKVINMSLSGEGTCDATFQNAINAAVSAGTAVVVAAGNNNDDASDYAPGNCANVITVAATTRNGNRASYSNYGSVVEISAPGGDSVNGVLSTSNSGTTVPASDAYYYYTGTSMAAPHVSGVVSLMFSRNPSLTPAQVLSILQATAKPFPTGSTCNTSICGSGIVNAASAVFNALPFTASYYVYVPLVIKQELLPSWTIIKSETFEGSFPNTWSVFDNDGSDNGTYYWGKRNCMAYQGSYSAWAVGAGTNGSRLSCGANYPDYAKSWLKYGSFSLSDAYQAELRYMLWLNSESGFDGVCRMASIDGNTFYGSCSAGYSNGWVEQTLDLSNVYTLGDLRGRPNVWILIYFSSDSSINYSYGALVDNVVVRKCTSAGGCAASGSAGASAEPSGLVETPMMLELKR